MKIQHPSPNKKVLLVVLVLIVTVIGIGGYYLYTKSVSTQSNQSYNQPTQQQIQNGQTIKKDSIDSKGSANSSSSDQVPSPTSNGDGEKATLGVHITSVNQNDSNLLVRSQLDSTITEGTCTLSLSKTGSATVTKTSGVQVLANTSTCSGFNVPLSELSAGSWNISLVFANDTLTGTANTTVTIQ